MPSVTHLTDQRFDDGTTLCGEEGPSTRDPNVADCYKCWRYEAFEAQRARGDAEKALREEREQSARIRVALGPHAPAKITACPKKEIPGAA